MLKCEGLWKIIEIAEKTSQDLLPSKAKRGLYKAFTLGGYAIDDKSKREEYWVQVVNIFSFLVSKLPISTKLIHSSTQSFNLLVTYVPHTILLLIIVTERILATLN